MIATAEWGEMSPHTYPLTDRQQAILSFIHEGIVEGCCPTVREIARQFGIRSPNGVMCHLSALEKKGLIQRSEMHARSIRLVGMKLEPRYLDNPDGRRLREVLRPHTPRMEAGPGTDGALSAGVSTQRR